MPTKELYASLIFFTLIRLVSSASLPATVQPIQSWASEGEGNVLSYVAEEASSPSGGANCAFVLEHDQLVFPNATLQHVLSGHIDCTARLVLSDLPAARSFSVERSAVSGYLSLEAGSFVESIEVDIGYGAVSVPDTFGNDQARARRPYGQSGEGYNDSFTLELSMASVDPSGHSGSSPCSSSVPGNGPVLTIRLWVGLSHEMISFDDNGYHYGTVGGHTHDEQLSMSLKTVWSTCS